MHHAALSAYMAQRKKKCARCRKEPAKPGSKYCSKCAEEVRREREQE